MRSTNTTHEFMLYSLRNWRRDLSKKGPSGHPVLGEAPNLTGVASDFKMYCRRDLITNDIIFDTTFKRSIPLQLFELDKLPFFERIFRHPICQSSIVSLV